MKKFFKVFFSTKIAKKGKKPLQILAEAFPKSFPLSKILAKKAEAIFNTGYRHRCKRNCKQSLPLHPKT
jgi:hypothetical protein